MDKGTPGFTVGKKLHKMGLRTSPMAELALQDCEIPVANLLGKEFGGQAVFTSSMEWERICILASHLGAMQRIMETCIKYAKERKQFGEPIGKFPAINNKIADMDVRLETGRLALYKAAWLKSQGRHPLREASIAKLYVSRSLREELSGSDSDPRRLRLHDGVRTRARTARRDRRHDLLRNIGSSPRDHLELSRVCKDLLTVHPPH